MTNEESIVKNEEIPTIQELIERYEKGEIPENPDSWFCVYFSEIHKNNNSLGWVPYAELAAWALLKKKVEENIDKCIKEIWGK